MTGKATLGRFGIVASCFAAALEQSDAVVVGNDVLIDVDRFAMFEG